MKFNFIATLPEKDSGRLMLDTPIKIDEIERKWCNKAKVMINGTCYLCNLFEKADGFYSIHLIRALKRDVGLGNTVEISLELLEKTQSDVPNIHDVVLKWEQNEGKELIRKIGIKNGESIVDFGCGFGHYTLPCALALNNTGKVYAVDCVNTGLKWIRKKAEKFNVSNIETIKTNGSLSMNFPKESMDIILLYDIVHLGINQEKTEAAIPIRFSLYKEANRVLKNGGILSILSFDSDMRNVPDKDYIRRKTTCRNLMSEVPEYGFELFNTVENGVHFDWYHNNYQMQRGFSFNDLEKGIIYNFIKNGNGN